MRLIIESGATKGDWRVVDSRGNQQMQILTSGTNVSTMPMSAIEATISDAATQIRQQGFSPEAIHLYTAGVITQSIRSTLSGLFNNLFPHSEVEILDDLTAAARAACGHQAGIAAILGTGSNSCEFDGEKIVKRVYSSGFILGDEGSAATLGKLFVADFLKGLIPESVAADFAARYPSDYATIVESVYRSNSSPSAYLGAFAPFILEHYDNPYIKRLVDDNFRAFINRSLRQYHIDRYPVGVVGGFGNALKDIFSRVAAEEGITISRYVASPIEELIKYHTL